MVDNVEDRVAVVATATTIGVTVTVGDVEVTVRSPLPAQSAQLTDQKVRANAVRAARRALEVALEELRETPVRL